MYYIKLLSTFNDIEDILEASVKYRVAYVKRHVYLVILRSYEISQLLFVYLNLFA